MTRTERAALNHVQQYERSNLYSLNDCYKNCSNHKWAAWEYCKNLRDKYNGVDLKIITYNQMMFTAGFTYADEDTGVVKFMYITKSYDVSIDYPCNL